MNLSNKLTFSFLFTVLLLSAMVMVPTVMAQTIEAEWTNDLNDDGTATDPGWNVTIGGLEEDNIATVYRLDPDATAARGPVATAFPSVETGETTSEGTIVAAIGVKVLVQVVAGESGSAVTYQRVTFPEAAPGAKVEKDDGDPIDLVLLPKLAKLETSQYYASFGETVTITFDFAPAKDDTNGDPMAPLHVSDVTLGTPANWTILGVSGTNMVMIRSTHDRGATSINTTVSIHQATPVYAQAADTEAEGQATLTYDDIAPTVTDGSINIAAPPGFPTPTDDVWNSTFILTFSISDDADPGSGLPDTDPVSIMTDETKLDVGPVGLGTATDTIAGTEYLVRITPKADRVTTAGEEVVITIVPIDKAGNEGGSSTIVKLSEVEAPTPPNNAPTTVGTIAAQTVTVDAAAKTVDVADKFNDTDALTYAATSNKTDIATVSIAGSVVTITAVKAGTATITVTATDTADQTATQTIAVTVKAAPVTLDPAATLSSADPADGDDIMRGQKITLTFAADPGTVTTDVGTIDDDDDDDKIKILTIPSDQDAGSVTIELSWTMDDHQDGSETLTYFVTINPAEPANISAPIEIPENSYVVVVRDMSSNAVGLTFPTVDGKDVIKREWSDMPDLEALFNRSSYGQGGALVVRKSADDRDNDNADGDGTYATPALGSVGISEIMWGLDLGLTNRDSQPGVQWIELHNVNSKPVKVLLYAQTARELVSDGLVGDTAADDSIIGGLGGMVIDAITNIRDEGNQAKGGWNLPGDNGNSVTGDDFTSMYRILPDKQPAYSASQNYTKRNGRDDGVWRATGTAYASARTDQPASATTDVVAITNYKGTPGQRNDYTGVSLITPAGRTGVSHAITINEVGNNSNNDYDWIELKGDAGKNLRNHMISIVTSNSSDVPLVQFPANDNAKIADNGVFLILRTDPANDPDHPIAATGYNVGISAEEQQPGTPNSPVRYIVSSGLNLPNDGKFVLILRRPDNNEGHRSGQNDGKGVAETGTKDLDKVVDVAGWDDDLAKNPYPNAVSKTGVWPLRSFRDIKGFTNNSFKENTVHQRNRVGTNDGASGVGAQDNNNGKTAFGDRGYTGVGYRRATAESAIHGGTPGYPNGASQGAGATITGSVYISEIMYADAANGSLPQWIELRNSSNTVSANLHNWRLTIKNHVDAETHEDGGWDGKLDASVLLRGLKIKPNGAVLITSRKGPRSEVHLATNEIFSLFPSHRGAFSMTNANSDVINPFGFRITLHANGHEGDRNKWQLADDVGNLATPDPNDRRGNNERFDMPRWEWPDAVDEHGSRSSVSRTNNMVDGLGVGSMEASWMLSSMDDRTNLIDYVYYGHTSDVSTPGQTVGSPLPVSLSFFRPTLVDGKVEIHWTTESELDNAGFNIYRSEDRNGEFTKVNEQLIQGKGTTAERSTYKWVDTSAKPGAVYYYQIEDVSFAGERNTLTTTKLKGLISAKNKLTTRWSELKSQN